MQDYLYFDIMEPNSAYNMRIGFLNGQMGDVYLFVFEWGKQINFDGGFEWTGPGTVFCDNMNLLFMFLSIATSNMVATSLAKRVSTLSCKKYYCFCS